MNDSNNLNTVRISKDELLKSLVPVILRQTDYDEEKAKEKLIEHNFNLKELLYEYMGVNSTKIQKSCTTSNQERYRLTRNSLDDANKKLW